MDLIKQNHWIINKLYKKSHKLLKVGKKIIPFCVKIQADIVENEIDNEDVKEVAQNWYSLRNFKVLNGDLKPPKEK